MAGVTFDQFFSGIAQQESGGNYSAVNASSGALGKYQIMPANVPGWSQQYLGVRWSPQQFLQDPAKQEALARAVLNGYFTKYGARGAASAWYSGNPALQNSYGPQNGGPSVGSYVDSVLMHATGSPGTAAHAAQFSMTTGGGANTASSFPTTTIDNTVKTPPAPTVASSSGMGAATAPGTEATIATPGADAVDSSTVGAVGEATTNLPEPVVGLPAPPATPGAGGTIGATSSASRNMAIAAAMKWIGTPYVWGGGSGSGPSRSAVGAGVGFDCSGLVQAALAAAGINAAHFSFTQLAMGHRTAIGQLQPGDLVGMNGGAHIGLYAGNNQIIVADHTGTNVQVRSIGSNEGAFGVSLANLFR
jgi:cell wall-associated NlpC family hydrolase